jgi:precorrin-6B methylase 2
MVSQVISIFTTDAPFVPIPKHAEKYIIDALELNSGSVLYDLGCGDGRILISAVKKYPDTKAVGVEIALLPYFLAKIRTRKYKNILIKRENIFETDLSQATHIFVYLYPGVVNKLILNIKQKCKAGTKIISGDFQIKDLNPEKIINIESNSSRGKNVFIYKI